ncbi:tape measure protein [Leminorella grimontii]|uniref:tape measure protein n=1 Tax=Leminorella grimontii TaxID=82981 RepID=UPI0020827E06|nr:tape measure protein [Leminorella grimontii]GKX58342.1 phage tail tape measure protein [Leminorella grimontii]
MATLRELIIKISANSQAYQRELQRAGRMGNDYYRSMQNGGRAAAAASRESQRALSTVTAELRTAKDAAMGFAGIFAAGFATRNLIEIADSYNSISSRLKLATLDSTDFTAAQRNLMEISQRTGSAFADNANLFSRSSAALREWGYGTGDILKLTEALSTGLQVSGASAAETSSAITQLSQALGRGVLRGQDFNSVAQAAPRLMKALADGMGVAQKDLKAMADAGELTADKVVPALISQLDKLRAEYASMPNSISAASTRISNAFMEWVGGANQASGATATISTAMDGVAKNIDTVASAAGVLAGVGLARMFGGWASSMTTATTALISQTRNQLALSVAQKEGLTVALNKIRAEKEMAVVTQQSLSAQLNAAQTERTRTAIRQQLAANSAQLIRLNQAETATVTQLASAQTRLSVASGLAKGALGLVGGPMGAAMLAGGALFYFSQRAEQAKQSAIDLSDKVKMLSQSMVEMSQTQRDAEAASLTKDVRETDDQIRVQKMFIEQTKEEVAQLERRVEAWGRFSLAEDKLVAKREDLKIKLGELEKMEAGREAALGRINELNSRSIPIIEQVVGVLDSLKQSGRDVTTEFADFDKALGQLNLQLDVAQLGAGGAAREAYILAGLQKVAGDAALKHKDDLLALAKGQMVSGAISEELAAKLTDYAAKLGQLFDDNQAKKSFGAGVKSADKLQQAYQRQNETLDQQIALFGKTTELAKMKYQLAHGELSSLDTAKKIALEQKAAELDKLNAYQAYKDLMVDVQTAEEKSLALTKERLQIIRNAKLSPDEAATAAEKVSKASVTKAPTFGGLSPEVGGAAGELINIAKAEGELKKWHDRQLEMQNELFAQKEISAETHAARLAEIEQMSADRRKDIQMAYTAASLGVISSMTGQMADMMAQMGDKSSAAYKVMFLTSKAASIAQAMISTEVAAAKALELGPIMGIPAASLIRGLGYASVGLIASQTIAGMAHDGIDNIPKEGTWLLDRGERVVDARTNSDLKNFLSNANGSRGGNITINVPVSADGGMNEQDARALSALIKAKVNEVLVEQSRDGGLLSGRR